MMTPKEQYEARKLERNRAQQKAVTDFERIQIETHEMLDRFVTAHEAIAVSLEMIAAKMAKGEL